MIIGFAALAQNAYGACLENEDWPDAPCLDSIADGWYDQDEVDRWASYYSYKGPEFMEQKYSEMMNAIGNETLNEWAGESEQNRNVYEYYFFSGRAPNTGEYRWQFEVIQVNESEKAANEKPSFPNMMPIKDYDYSMIGILATLSAVAAGIATVLVVFWRRRKRS